MPPVKRWPQFVYVAAWLPLCWLLMMAAHEAGHVLAAFATGGKVVKVVVHPLALSRSDVDPNPKPRIVAWCGPVFGASIPLAAAFLLERALSSPSAAPPRNVSRLARFFAGFCLIANGAYLGAGALLGAGDASDLQRYGSADWPIWLFAAIAVSLGMGMWHSLGRRLGLGERTEITPLEALCMAAALAFACALAVALSPRS